MLFTDNALNVAKVFNIGSWRYDARIEMFKLLNSGVQLAHQSGGNGRGTSVARQLTSYERVSQLLDGRVIRFAVTAAL